MSVLPVTEAQGEGDRLPLLHRQHAVGQRPQARRRADDPQRQDRRDPQHRRRGPPRPGRRAVAGGGGRARRHRRHRHAHRRVHAGPRPEDRRRHGQRRGAGSTRCEAAADRTDEPVWPLPLPARLPQAARQRRGRHEEHRRRVRRRHRRRPVPAGVRRRHAVGPPRHRRPDAVRAATTAGVSKGATAFGVRRPLSSRAAETGFTARRASTHRSCVGLQPGRQPADLAVAERRQRRRTAQPVAWGWASPNCTQRWRVRAKGRCARWCALRPRAPAISCRSSSKPSG